MTFLVPVFIPTRPLKTSSLVLARELSVVNNNELPKEHNSERPKTSGLGREALQSILLRKQTHVQWCDYAGVDPLDD